MKFTVEEVRNAIRVTMAVNSSTDVVINAVIKYVLDNTDRSEILKYNAEAQAHTTFHDKLMIENLQEHIRRLEKTRKSLEHRVAKLQHTRDFYKRVITDLMKGE